MSPKSFETADAWSDTTSFHDEELSLPEVNGRTPLHGLKRSERLGLIAEKDVAITRRRNRLRKWLPFLAHVVSFTISLTILLGSLSIHQLNSDHNSETEEKFGTYFDIHINNDFEERFFDDSINSPFRGPPTPDVEKRWNDLHNVTYRMIDFDELYESGGPASSVKFFENQYPANLAIFHQMHCLTILWQHTWMDWYGDNVPEIFAYDDEQLIHDHLDHCADILRQALMCNPDTSTLVYRRDSKNDIVMNFGLPRRCRKFDPILEWGKEHEWHKES